MSELMATGVLQIGDWVRDDLPDLIWPALAMTESGPEIARQFVKWQKVVQLELEGEVEPRIAARCLDGRLSSLESLRALSTRAPEIVTQTASDLGLLGARTTQVLASFPMRPATWLTDTGGSFRPIDQEGLDFLAQAIFDVLKDAHREALIKCLDIWSLVQAGAFRTDEQTISLLRDYPNDLSTRPVADSVVRASWGANLGLVSATAPERREPTIEWARQFWTTNSATSTCIRSKRSETTSHTSTEDEDEDEVYAAPASTPTEGLHYRRLAMDLMSSFFEALETSPSRLYEVELHEVHTGIVTRIGRAIISALGAPDLWNSENGSHITRSIVEGRIHTEWMTSQEPSIYSTYQGYGFGKAKLYARILDEIREGVDLPGLDDGIREFERLSHDDSLTEYRIVDTSDSFSGKSLRTMAQECGLLDLHRRAYQMASGATHGEWWSIEVNCMERCMNILHRGHLIPTLTIASHGNAAIAKAWIDQLYDLILRSLEIQEARHDTVQAAFEWLRDEPAEGP